MSLFENTNNSFPTLRSLITSRIIWNAVCAMTTFERINETDKNVGNVGISERINWTNPSIV